MQTRGKRAGGFSLIEVVVALGILAVGGVLVLGLVTPVTRSVSATIETETAARAAESAVLQLQAMPWAEVDGRLKSEGDFAAQLQSERGGLYDPLRDAQLLFVSREGGRVVGAEGPDAEKYYELTLVRNERLVPAASAATSPVLVFTVRVRWPTLVATGAGCVQVGAGGAGEARRFDHSQKETRFFAASLRR